MKEETSTKHNAGSPQKYFLDDRKRRLFFAYYDGTSAQTDRLIDLLGVPRWRVQRWANELGLTTPRQPLWTIEEEEYIEKNLHKKSITAIAKHLKRTRTAVRLRAKRLGVNKTSEGYTMVGLCQALGCDHKKAESWVTHGLLVGKRRMTERNSGADGDTWLFTDTDIRKFVIAHPLEIDHRRIEWPWMVDLLAGKNNGGIGRIDVVPSRGERP